MTTLTTGNLNQDYEIIDAIFAIDSHKGGFLTAVDPGKAFDGVKAQLRKSCESLGGNAVVHCQFEYRNASTEGFVGKKQVIEIFCIWNCRSYVEWLAVRYQIRSHVKGDFRIGNIPDHAITRPIAICPLSGG